jgi:glycosyltransferase involved in cell wall biosynthesis
VSYAATILVPLLRQVPDYLATALRSATEQTLPAEVLIVSSSATPASNTEMIEAFRRSNPGSVRVVELDGVGFARALNLGFREAASDRVALLFSDDWLEQTAVEATVAINADVVSGGKRIWRQDDDGELVLIREWVGSESELGRQPTSELRASYVAHMLLLSRPRVLELGGVDESLGDVGGVDDFDLIWTMLDAGASVGFTEAPQYNLRDHGGERLTLRPRDQQLAALLRILDKHGVTDPVERDSIVARHSRWYGKTISAGLDELEAESYSSAALQ